MKVIVPVPSVYTSSVLSSPLSFTVMTDLLQPSYAMVSVSVSRRPAMIQRANSQALPPHSMVINASSVPEHSTRAWARSLWYSPMKFMTGFCQPGSSSNTATNSALSSNSTVMTGSVEKSSPFFVHFTNMLPASGAAAKV